MFQTFILGCCLEGKEDASSSRESAQAAEYPTVSVSNCLRTDGWGMGEELQKLSQSHVGAPRAAGRAVPALGEGVWALGASLGMGMGVRMGEGTMARHIPWPAGQIIFCCFPWMSRKQPVPRDRQAGNERDSFHIQISLAVKSPFQPFQIWTHRVTLTGRKLSGVLAIPVQVTGNPAPSGKVPLGQESWEELRESLWCPLAGDKGRINHELWVHTKAASWESIKGLCQNQQRHFSIDSSQGICEFVLNENPACLTSHSCSTKFHTGECN